MSFVCTRMSSTCHSYVLVYHPYVILATTLIPILFIRIFLGSAARFGNLNNLKGAHIISCSHVQRSAWTNFFPSAQLIGRAFLLASPMGHAKNGRSKQNNTSDQDTTRNNSFSSFDPNSSNSFYFYCVSIKIFCNEQVLAMRLCSLNVALTSKITCSTKNNFHN